MNRTKQQLAAWIKTGIVMSHSACDYNSILIQIRSEDLKQISWRSHTSSTLIHFIKQSQSMPSGITVDEAKPEDVVLEGTSSTLTAFSSQAVWEGWSWSGLTYRVATRSSPQVAQPCSPCANIHQAAEGLLLARCFLASWGHAYFLLIRDNISRDLRFPRLHVTTLVPKPTQPLTVYIHYYLNEKIRYR